jgi:hypothetical protein
MLAASLHAARDTGRLAALADSIERDGQRAWMFRPRAQHHFVRGLLLSMRGDDSGAVRELTLAVTPVAADFGRANIALADIHMTRHRPREAIAVLQPLTRGWFMETTNMHITLTEVHERLLRAYEAAGLPDSASAERAWLSRARQLPS